MHNELPSVPVIDLFAGPGGLGEGFASFMSGKTKPFKITLSIEKDAYAFETLKLRSFYRQFSHSEVPQDYYEFLRGEISRKALFRRHSDEYKMACSETWRMKLGGWRIPPEKIEERINNALHGTDTWVLIGGPPCQAYSLIGRVKIKNESAKRKRDFEKDHRHFLYREYLKIISVHKPPVFVMENVPGLLSSKINGSSTFERILSDLQYPLRAISELNGKVILKGDGRELKYHTFPLVKPESGHDNVLPSDYVIKAENYGIPQARHRVIVLGVRSDFNAVPNKLTKVSIQANTWDVISDLPRIRSRLSKDKDSLERWQEVICSIKDQEWFKDLKNDDVLKRKMIRVLDSRDHPIDFGQEYYHLIKPCKIYADWYQDERMDFVCNHTSRSHMAQDILRYFYASCFAEAFNKSPKIVDFPGELRPKHKNVEKAVTEGLFSDRFRVQVKDRPATTITSHISKDGHYYIHPDPQQCRSLTVREAARLQTFPDNYYFAGKRTEQFHQVGNAVPPLLARSIAEIVYKMFAEMEESIRK